MPVVHVAHDLRLQLVSRPGSMASLLAAFDSHEVAVHGVLALGERDLDEDHFLVNDADAAVAAALTVGASELGRRPVLVVELDRIGLTATGVLERVAAAGAGIDLMYMATNGALVIGAIPHDAALIALQATSE
jgi:hypothetical protein